MSSDFDIGQTVEWDWGNGTAEGKVVERFTEKISRTIKENEVTRDASTDKPAYLIEQDDGDEVLKSVTEIREA